MGIGIEPLGNSQIKLVPEGGLAIRLINDTGAPSIKGYLCEAGKTIDDSFIYIIGDSPDPIGVVYDDGVADGKFVWIVVSGIADVYYSDSVTRGTFSRNATAGESLPAGVAVSEPLPVPPFATDKHFLEIGHPIASRIGAGLAKTILHFN